MTPSRRVLLVFEGGPDMPYLRAAIDAFAFAPYDPVFVGIGPRGPLHDYALARGVPAVALSIDRAKGYPTAIARLRREIRRHGPALLHASEPVSAVIAGLAATGTGVPVLYHRHHILVEQRELPFRTLARMAPVLSNMTMAVSDATARAATRDRPRRLVCVATNGLPDLRAVSDDELVNLRARLGIDPTHRVVLVLGRMRPVKGHRIVLAAWERLQCSGSAESAHLVLVGDGPEAPGLRREAAEKSLPKVHFVGASDDVAPWYALADVVVIPSLLESFGLVAVEAMAASRPIVASRVGGLPEVVVDGETGVLVAPGVPQDLADALSRLLESPDVRVHLGRAGRARYEDRFTAEHMVCRWVRCYDRLLDSRA